MRSHLAGALLSILGSTLLFLTVLQFMPDLWKMWAEMLAIPKWFYDVTGFLGLTGICLSVIALKSGLFGPLDKGADQNPWFVSINALGALLHLVSFGYYHNPNGIALDTVYTIVGVYGLCSLALKPRKQKHESLDSTVSIGRFFVIVGGTQLAFLALVWVIWPSVMEVARPYEESYFHYAGNIGGICILAVFFGQMLRLMSAGSVLYDFVYSVGIWGYIFNLCKEFNPYTVALELTLFTFFFVKLKK